MSLLFVKALSGDFQLAYSPGWSGLRKVTTKCCSQDPASHLSQVPAFPRHKVGALTTFHILHLRSLPGSQALPHYPPAPDSHICRASSSHIYPFPGFQAARLPSCQISRLSWLPSRLGRLSHYRLLLSLPGPQIQSGRVPGSTESPAGWEAPGASPLTPDPSPV